MTDKLTLAVNHALNDARMARARMGLMAPTMELDNKRHSAWCEYGFPEQVTYENLYACIGAVVSLTVPLRSWLASAGRPTRKSSRVTMPTRARMRLLGRRSPKRYSLSASGEPLLKLTAAAWSVAMLASCCTLMIPEHGISRLFAVSHLKR